MTERTLSPSQSAALLDILTHAETYAEIRDFRYPGTLQRYGPPFARCDGPSTSPALQALVSRFLLNFPGVKDFSNAFWQIMLQEIIEGLEESNLSESYDKGSLGIRRTLATAISALIEYPVRGTYGGIGKIEAEEHRYDLKDASDLSRAFMDFVNGAVYGTALDDLVKKSAETSNLADHTTLIQAVHEFILVNLASLMHFTLIISPKGQYLLKLIDNANKLIPYVVIKQTLKIGNVASMISAMMRVILAKMSVTSVTNWIGLTAAQDDGQNLMQYIISTVLSWDNKDLESRALKIEKELAMQGKEQLAVLKAYPRKSREDQERIRQQSEHESMSIVKAILKESHLPKHREHIDERNHQQALDYLAIHLSIRDRKQIIQVLCHSQPDRLTQAAREGVAAYEPVLRHLHNAVELSDTVADAEHFIRDTIKVAKIQPSKDGKVIVPTVGDFVQLLRRHQHACHKFVHQCCKNGEELTSWYLKWAKTAASQFRRDNHHSSAKGGAGNLTESLNRSFQALPIESQERVVQILDAQSEQINEIHAASQARFASVLITPPSRAPTFPKMFGISSRPSSRPASRANSPERHLPTPVPQPSGIAPKVSASPGPGAYLARWQDLLDNAKLTPMGREGEVEKTSGGTDAVGEKPVGTKEANSGQEQTKTNMGKRDVGPVLDVFLKDFRTLLAEKSFNW